MLACSFITSCSRNWMKFLAAKMSETRDVSRGLINRFDRRSNTGVVVRVAVVTVEVSDTGQWGHAHLRQGRQGLEHQPVAPL